jgi:hypothetical protein
MTVTVRMVERVERGRYRRASRSEITRMLDAGTIVLEGADGDEELDTVTYWFSRDTEGDG